jgi:branched-chain amino acid transport system substrate-binding protein
MRRRFPKGRLFSAGMAVTLAVTVAACGSSGGGSSTAAATASGAGTSSSGGGSLQGKTVNVGAVVPLTGPISASGKGCLAGAKAAVQYLNSQGSQSGAKLKLDVRDDAGDSTKAVAATRQLASAGIVAILNCATPGANLALQPVVNQAQILDLGPAVQGLESGVGPNGKYPWVFGTGPSNPQLTALQMQYAKRDLGAKKIAEIYSSDPVGMNQHTGAVQFAKHNGIDLVSQSFSPQQTDVTAQLSKLKASGAKTLAIWTYGTPLVTVATDLAKLNWDPQVITVLGATDPAVLSTLKQRAPKVLKGMVSGPLAKTFISDKKQAPPSSELGKKWATYTQKVNHRALNGNDYVGVYLFDAVIALDRGMAKADSTDPAAIRKVFNSQPIQISQGTTDWPTSPAMAVTNNQLGVFLTGSDLTDGTGTAPPKAR